MRHSPSVQNDGPRGRKKIVIFYSSIGHGHISAAQAIQEEIGRQEPGARVILQDIREFMHPVWRWVDERLYWFLAANLPESFDNLFLALEARGNRVPSPSSLPNDYAEEKVLAFLEALAPDAVLATHYGSAQVLGRLRERGLEPGLRIGWLHTDFFEGYFPRLSKRIDQTFLAHPELEKRWLAAGVPPDKVTTGGMPVRVAADEPETREIALTGLGLAADTPTVLLTGGKEGVGDFPAVIESIARHHEGRVQIIAVCGTNAKQQTLLAALQERLPPQVMLKVLGLVPHQEMLSCMRAAGLLITKPGGMTPAEAFAMGLPTILLDVVSGHERDNAAFFVRLGVAELAADTARAGELAAFLLENPDRTEAMRRAQRAFRENGNIAKIARFALDDSFAPARLPPDFGAEHGSSVVAIEEALQQLDMQAPCDIEVLLSFSTSKSPTRVVFENPFGHLAIRVGDTVYSVNYVADRGRDPNLLQQVTLSDYLYGVHPPSPSQVHTNTYGMAYGRETLGLRVAGIPARHKAAMVAEAHRIEEQFQQGTLRYDKSEFNCADAVARILRVGGYGRRARVRRQWLPVMPLDLFEKARAAFEQDASLRVELVAYRQVPGAKAAYRFSRFPLSLGQPVRSLARVLSNVPRDPLVTGVTKQVTGCFGDRRLYFEDLRARWSTSDIDEPPVFGRLHRRLASAAVADLRRLVAANAKLSLQELERLGDLYSAQEVRRLIDHTLDLARIATERAEEILRDPARSHLRVRFTELVGLYGRIGTWRLQARQVKAYLRRFQAFEAAIAREFSGRRGTQLRRASALWPSLRRSVEPVRCRVSRRRRSGSRGKTD